MKNNLKVETFSIGILKAVVEKDDISKYFGSTLSLNYWLDKTIKLGFITEIRCNKFKETKLGKKIYKKFKLKTLPNCRSYFWDSKICEEIKQFITSKEI